MAAENLAAAKKRWLQNWKRHRLPLELKSVKAEGHLALFHQKEISDAIKTQLHYDIDKKKIVLKDAIKAVGSFTVKIKLHPQVQAELSVKVEEAD